MVNPNWLDYTAGTYTASTTLLVYEINRMAFFVFLLFVGLGSGMHILRTYKINYIHIFELDPKRQLTQIQLYMIGILLMAIFFLFYLI